MNALTQSKKFHIPVLLEEAIEMLNIDPKGIYVDVTLGGGGHSYEIQDKLTTGKLISFDRDIEAIDHVKQKYAPDPAKWILFNKSFSTLQVTLNNIGITQVNGVLADLGVSTHQLEERERGFSFQKNGPLDMRMDQSSQVTAADLVNALSVKELKTLFEKYGEERYSREIAQAIVDERKLEPIKTTGHLTRIIESIVPSAYREGKKHPARRVFQALRMATNSEVEELREVLGQTFSVLQPTGRFVGISFHSIEEGLIKDFFSEKEKAGQVKNLTSVPIEPSPKEISRNWKSRSAKLQAYEKI